MPSLQVLDRPLAGRCALTLEADVQLCFAAPTGTMSITPRPRASDEACPGRARRYLGPVATGSRGARAMNDWFVGKGGRAVSRGLDLAAVLDEYRPQRAAFLISPLGQSPGAPRWFTS
jgi:hypothetical protein